MRHQEGHPPVALTVMRTRLEVTSACAYACVCDERPLDYPFVTGSSGRELPALMATPAIAKGDVCVDHGDLLLGPGTIHLGTMDSADRSPCDAIH